MTEDDLKEKKYIEIVYTLETQSQLMKYCQEHDFDNTVSSSQKSITPRQFEFHSTIWYTTTTHSLKNNQYQIDEFEVIPIGFELFGPTNNILVLRIEGKGLISDPLSGTDTLLKLRTMFGDAYDMDDEWPDYKPHITLSYNHQGDIPDIELPSFPMTANLLRIKTAK